MVRARTYPDNGNLESVNYSPKAEELQPDDLGKKKIEDNKKNEEQGSDVSYTYVSNIKRKFRCNEDLQFSECGARRGVSSQVSKLKLWNS